ncbi:MAG: hypothetical protein HYU39_00695 [Thaumarchaeota archaeon]|nr:hypothetical protein [Nitrososphaerota archaeon]
MTETLVSHEIGSLKKPIWLVNTVRNKSLPKETKDTARDDSAYLNLKILEEIGLDLVYDGEARRVEMYEYPIRHIEGFEFAGRVRSWDNKYFRKARCVGEVKLRDDYHNGEFLFLKNYATKPLKIPVTGPYTLADWSYNEYYPSREEFVIALARKVIRPLLRGLVEIGAEYIQVDEPAATTHPDEMKMFVEAYNEAVKSVPGSISVHICYSGDNYRSLFPHVLEMKTSHFALEFANRDTWDAGGSKEAREGYSALEYFKGNRDLKVGLGVLDVHRDAVEPPKLVKDRILYAAKVLGDASRVLVNPDCGLRTRSREVAFAKLRSMVEGVKLARKELE